MKLYLLYEDVGEEYGCELRAYGIFTSKEKAEKAREELTKIKRCPKRFLDISGIDSMMIGEFDSDEIVDELLGGYEDD